MNIIDILKSIFPFFYTFKTRYNSLSTKASWFISYPLILFCLIIFHDYEVVPFLIYFILSVLTYEAGYIYNDNITILKENNPTIREQFKFSKDYPIFLMLIKLSISLFGGWYLFDWTGVIGLALLFFAFLIHNIIRSNFNIITYLFLFLLKFIVPIYPVLSINENIGVYISIFILIIVPRTIEHSTRNRYQLKYKILLWISNKRELFRLIYMLIFSSIILLLYIHITNVLVIVIVNFIYRIIVFCNNKLDLIKRRKHPDYNY